MIWYIHPASHFRQDTLAECDIQSARYNVVRAGTYHTRTLRHIVDTAKSIATSIVGASLDYCNSFFISLFYGTSEGNLERLQRVQNQVARVVLQAPWMLVLRTCAVNFIGCQ